jgi:diguanylate cyclase (GGDEF)-like protein/PAS domain S-box-containing protein
MLKKNETPVFDAALRHALVESRRRYKDFVEMSGDFVWETDVEGRFVFVSAEGLLGWSAEDMLGRRCIDFIGEGVEPAAFSCRLPVSTGDLWFRAADGGSACFTVTARPRLGDDGAWLGARGVCREVTEERAREREVAEARARERLMAHLARTLRDHGDPSAAPRLAAEAIGAALGAAGGVVLSCAAEAEAPIAWGETLSDDLLADARSALARAADPAAVALLRNGRAIAASAVWAGSVQALLLFARDPSAAAFQPSEEMLLSEAAPQLGAALVHLDRNRRLQSLARLDPGTGLLNRRAFVELLERAMPRGGTLLYLDLDNLKLVNDSFGHAAGDEAILAITRVLNEVMRPLDVTGRLGGDEFGIWLGGASEAGAQAVTERLRSALAPLADRSGNPAFPFGASIGIAHCPAGTPETIPALLARADAAMYRNKRSRR